MWGYFSAEKTAAAILGAILNCSYSSLLKGLLTWKLLLMV